jgi:hypothetical protein
MSNLIHTTANYRFNQRIYAKSGAARYNSQGVFEVISVESQIFEYFGNNITWYGSRAKTNSDVSTSKVDYKPPENLLGSFNYIKSLTPTPWEARHPRSYPSGYPANFIAIGDFLKDRSTQLNTAGFNNSQIDTGLEIPYLNTEIYEEIKNDWYSKIPAGFSPFAPGTGYGLIPTLFWIQIELKLQSYEIEIEQDFDIKKEYKEPNFTDFYNGYTLEPENFTCKVKLDFNPTENKSIRLDYYQYANEVQTDSDLNQCKTYAHTTNILNLKQGESFYEELELVPCSLISDDESIFGLFQNNGNFFGKDWASLDKLPDLRSRWMALLAAKIAQDTPQGILTIIQGTNHRISANNNIWNNGTIEPDINPNIGSIPSTQWIYTKYLEPHLYNNWGTYIMPDSPAFLDTKSQIDQLYRALQGDIYGVQELPPEGKRIPELIGGIDEEVETKITETHKALNAAVYGAEDAEIDLSKLIDQLHKCLEADKYALNLEGDNPVKITLAKYLTRISALMGYRPQPDGTYSIEKEKTLVRRPLQGKQAIDNQKSGGNHFADEAMLVRRLPNKFRRGKLSDGGVVRIHDLPQLMLEILDQLNLSLGLQEAANLTLQTKGKQVTYPNQTALLADLAIGQSQAIEFSKKAMFASLVAQQQTSELIAGIGLPVISKTMPIKQDKSTYTLPYWAIAPNHSITRSIDTVAYNVGIVTGQLI